MCGIIGFAINTNEKVDGKDIIINGLKKMEYRGYDSAGFSFINKNKIDTYKEKGRISVLEKKTEKIHWYSGIAIGHTRWATHGKPSKINSHPQNTNNVSVVHNGIIENYLELKKEMEKKGYHFNSQTDTEIIAVLLDYYFLESKDPINAIEKTILRLNGSYSIAIIFKNIQDKIFAIKKDSPLIIAKTKIGNMISSDINAINEYCNKYYSLNDFELAIVSENNIEFIDAKTNKKITKEIKEIKNGLTIGSKTKFKHYMLKEIYEQSELCENYLNNYQETNYPIKEIEKIKWNEFENIVIVACGTSMYSGLIGSFLINKFTKFNCYVEIASEFRYNKFKLNKKTLAIFISQSGETADTIAALRICKKNNIKTLGIVNVMESTIANESDYVIFTNAGAEIAVASTKAYMMQSFSFTFIANYLINLNNNIDTNLSESLKIEIDLLKKQINKIHSNAKVIAKDIYKSKNMFFIGRGIDYFLCQEASLKTKEISYIHTESYAAGELKHGTISLIKKNIPVISLITQKNILDKMISNIQEVNSRGALSIVVCNKSFNFDKNGCKYLVEIENINEDYSFINFIVFFQLLSYEISLLLGNEIDNPRNLAKSVTVE